jgi:uroporphyrin-III C-methyltransferase / precorrin-2 dehydrogenase / sirohydrochlorin ferrochelatase
MGSFSLPISLDVEGRRCVVVGGGIVAEHKARSLLDAGAHVVAIAPSFTEGLEELTRRARGAAGSADLDVVRRPYEWGDLEDAFLVVAATDDPGVNAAVFDEAVQRSVLVNAVDDVEHCTFAFPSVVQRGDLMLAISTGGKAPALAKRLRRTLSAELGPEYGVLVDVLAEVRSALMPRTMPFEEWARRWEQALEEDLPALVREGRIADVRELVLRCLTEGTDRAVPALHGAGPIGPPASASACGTGASGSAAWIEGWEVPRGYVSIVGAGPGDPDLITVRGLEAVKAADIVVHDRLVHPGLLEGKRTIFAGKQPGGPATSQQEINELLVRLARCGLRVVRLKGGDPFVFGRGAEEAEALAAAGIDFEIVPGPTSAIAAPAYAGIPVTDRRCGSSVAFVTGHSATGEVDWSRLAACVDTIVVLMGIRRLPEITAELLAGGLDPRTPAAAIEWGTLANQRVVTTEIGTMAEAAAAEGIASPAVVVIGDVVALRQRIAWFERARRDPTPTASAG